MFSLPVICVFVGYQQPSPLLVYYKGSVLNRMTESLTPHITCLAPHPMRGEWGRWVVVVFVGNPTTISFVGLL